MSTAAVPAAAGEDGRGRSSSQETQVEAAAAATNDAGGRGGSPTMGGTALDGGDPTGPPSRAAARASPKPSLNRAGKGGAARRDSDGGRGGAGASRGSGGGSRGRAPAGSRTSYPPSRPPGTAETRHSSRYRGVQWDRGSRRWRARIHTDRTRHIGYYEDEADAGAAWDTAALRHFGLAVAMKLNFGEESIRKFEQSVLGSGEGLGPAWKGGAVSGRGAGGLGVAFGGAGAISPPPLDFADAGAGGAGALARGAGLGGDYVAPASRGGGHLALGPAAGLAGHDELADYREAAGDPSRGIAVPARSLGPDDGARRPASGPSALAGEGAHAPLQRYRGVAPHGSRFKAVVNDRRRPVILGIFDTPEQAARAYDVGALQKNGPGSVTNFPLSDYLLDPDGTVTVDPAAANANVGASSDGGGGGAADGAFGGLLGGVDLPLGSNATLLGRLVGAGLGDAHGGLPDGLEHHHQQHQHHQHLPQQQQSRGRFAGIPGGIGGGFSSQADGPGRFGPVVGNPGSFRPPFGGDDGPRYESRYEDGRPPLQHHPLPPPLRYAGANGGEYASGAGYLLGQGAEEGVRKRRREDGSADPSPACVLSLGTPGSVKGLGASNPPSGNGGDASPFSLNEDVTPAGPDGWSARLTLDLGTFATRAVAEQARQRVAALVMGLSNAEDPRGEAALADLSQVTPTRELLMSDGVYYAVLDVRGRPFKFGPFATSEEATSAHDRCSLVLHGPTAVTLKHPWHSLVSADELAALAGAVAATAASKEGLGGADANGSGSGHANGALPSGVDRGAMNPADGAFGGGAPSSPDPQAAPRGDGAFGAGAPASPAPRAVPRADARLGGEGADAGAGDAPSGPHDSHTPRPVPSASGDPAAPGRQPAHAGSGAGIAGLLGDVTPDQPSLDGSNNPLGGGSSGLGSTFGVSALGGSLGGSLGASLGFGLSLGGLGSSLGTSLGGELNAVLSGAGTLASGDFGAPGPGGGERDRADGADARGGPSPPVLGPPFPGGVQALTGYLGHSSPRGGAGGALGAQLPNGDAQFDLGFSEPQPSYSPSPDVPGNPWLYTPGSGVGGGGDPAISRLGAARATPNALAPATVPLADAPMPRSPGCGAQEASSSATCRPLERAERSPTGGDVADAA